MGSKVREPSKPAHLSERGSRVYLPTTVPLQSGDDPACIRLDEAGVPYQTESGTSVYFRDPDGARLELIADPLGEMYGTTVR